MIIKEDYCSFEIAKLLQEKEFDEKCRASFDENGKFYIHKYFHSQIECGDGYLAPTHQEVMRWLREKYNLLIVIDKDYDNTLCWKVVSLKTKTISPIWTETGFTKFEKATESAIKYCLENLI